MKDSNPKPEMLELPLDLPVSPEDVVVLRALSRGRKTDTADYLPFLASLPVPEGSLRARGTHCGLPPFQLP
jgi:hypothetical protein